MHAHHRLTIQLGLVLAENGHQQRCSLMVSLSDVLDISVRRLIRPRIPQDSHTTTLCAGGGNKRHKKYGGGYSPELRSSPLSKTMAHNEVAGILAQVVLPVNGLG